MMLVVNDSLKFEMAILQTHCYFLLKKIAKDSHILSTKNNSVQGRSQEMCNVEAQHLFSVKITCFSYFFSERPGEIPYLKKSR